MLVKPRTRLAMPQAACALVALLACGIFLAETAAAAPIAKSNFNSGTEGWKVVGDQAAGREDPTPIATGGDPGPYVEAEDAATGGTMYWRAPGKFRGDILAAFEGSLTFSLTQSSSANQFDNDDVILEGAATRLVFDLPANPAVFPLWTSYSVGLGKTGWTDETNKEPATRRDMRQVLQDVDELQIRAEYVSGNDTDGLDTVKLRKPNPTK